MNDHMAQQTIEDHRYLLEQVENRVAIAFFAVANRNQALYLGLKRYCRNEELEIEEEMKQNKHDDSKNGKATKQ